MRRGPTQEAAQALAMLRLVTGAILVVGAAGKMKFYPLGGVLPVPVTTLTWQLDLPIKLSAWLANHRSGVAAAIVRDLLLPNGAVAAALLSWVEVIAGVLLVVGLRTRLAAIAACFVSAALVLAGGGVSSVGGRPYLLLLVVLLVLILGDAGQFAGVDGWRRERRRDRNL